MKKNIYTANTLTVLSTAFGNVFATVIWLSYYSPKQQLISNCTPQSSLSVMCTAVDCDNYCQITVANVTQLLTVKV